MKLDKIHLLFADVIATESSFSLALAHDRDETVGYDLMETVKGCCKILSDAGYIRWYIKDYLTHFIIVVQEGDIWNVRKGRSNDV